MRLAGSNFEQIPNRFSSPYGKIANVGCAGTKLNVSAAQGKYVSYQKGGKGGPCLVEPIKPLPNTGSSSGYAPVRSCSGFNEVRPLNEFNNQFGGSQQPYSNVPISFGYSVAGKPLTSDMSALANPAPHYRYDHCMKGGAKKSKKHRKSKKHIKSKKHAKSRKPTKTRKHRKLHKSKKTYKY